MRIVTVNLLISYLKMIEKLTGNQGLYPSRSELIRVALRDFLIRELDTAKTCVKLQKKQLAEKPAESFDETLFVRVPMSDVPTDYKTYKLIRRANQ